MCSTRHRDRSCSTRHKRAGQNSAEDLICNCGQQEENRSLEVWLETAEAIMRLGWLQGRPKSRQYANL